MTSEISLKNVRICFIFFQVVIIWDREGERERWREGEEERGRERKKERVSWTV